MSTPEKSDPVRALEFAFEPDEAAHALIGAYKLLEKIGEGGFGVVWLAEQQEPVRRRVALKIIKTGMDTRELIARFEAERQALALMDHPNIARVFAAGATEAGRPYFVMELMRGTPITQFCDENCVPTEARLRLFIDVCRAVQHAHQKGIIHRDLKPSNILVVDGDSSSEVERLVPKPLQERNASSVSQPTKPAAWGQAAPTSIRPIPKIIDFGIAKALGGARLTDKTLFTRFHTFIGTPAYTSPEQIGMSGLDLDTRSDIYSLGVLLYELLTGRPPFDAEQLNNAGLDEARRTILEVDPPRPSQRLRTLELQTRDTIARQRATDVAKLSLVLRGDLDWVVMRCLEKDRARRYESAAALAADVERHLAHEPVVARPPSANYALQKLVRRHRGVFAAAGAIAAVLVVGAVVSTWQAFRATRAEHEQSRLRETETVLRLEAQRAQLSETKLREEAQRQELAARRRAYAGDMNGVQQALDEENRGRALALLNRQRPQPGETDLRGWEWRYLWQFCQSEAKSALVQAARYSFSSVAASPDGKWIATEWDRLPVILDTQSGTKVEIPGGKGADLVAFSPREPILAIVGRRAAPTPAGYVMLWNFETRQKVREWIYSSSADPCTGIFFSEDSQTLVTSTVSPQNEIRLWRVATGEKLAGFSTGPTAGRTVESYFAINRDLTAAAYVSEGGTHVHVIDLVTGGRLWSARAAVEHVLALRFSLDGRILASGESIQDSPIRLWDAVTGHELGRLEGNRLGVTQMVFLPDGKILASAGRDQTVRLWDMETRRLLRTLRGHRDEVYCLALLPPGNKTLVSGSKNGEMFLWDTTAPEPVTRAHNTIPGNIMVWRFSEDGGAIITVEPDGRIAERRGENYRDEQTLFQVGAEVWGADKIARATRDKEEHPSTGSTILAGDSPRFAHVHADGNIEVWDWETGRRVSVIPATRETMRQTPLGFTTRGERLLLSRVVRGSSQRIIREEWEVATGRQTRTWNPETSLQINHEPFASLSPDQKRLMAIAGPSALVRTDLDGGREIRLALDLVNVGAMGSFSPDGSLFAAPTMHALVHVVNVDPLRNRTTLSGFLLGVHSAVFSPDGSRLATGSGGREAMVLWDVGSYERLLTLRATGTLFRQASFSPDGNVLGALSGNREKPTLQLWRAPTMAEIEAAEKTTSKERR